MFINDGCYYQLKTNRVSFYMVDTVSRITGIKNKKYIANKLLNSLVNCKKMDDCFNCVNCIDCIMCHSLKDEKGVYQVCGEYLIPMNHTDANGKLSNYFHATFYQEIMKLFNKSLDSNNKL